MGIHAFMAACKRFWEATDSEGFATLFAPGAAYHITPFDVQIGHAAQAKYWGRIKLQRDIHLDYKVLSEEAGIAHWHVKAFRD